MMHATQHGIQSTPSNIGTMQRTSYHAFRVSGNRSPSIVDAQHPLPCKPHSSISRTQYSCYVKSSCSSMVQAIPVLMPELLAIVSQDGQYSKDIQRRALEIAHTVISVLAMVSGDEQKHMLSLLGPMLGPWFEQFGRVLSSATDAQVSLVPAPAGHYRLSSMTIQKLGILFLSLPNLLQQDCTITCRICQTQASSLLPGIRSSYFKSLLQAGMTAFSATLDTARSLLLNGSCILNRRETPANILLPQSLLLC